MCVENVSEEIMKSILLMLGTAESTSEHPIGKAILNYSMEKYESNEMPEVRIIEYFRNILHIYLLIEFGYF